MKQVYIFIMFTLIGVNIMCFGKSTTMVRHYKGHHEIGIRSKNVIAEKELADCIIYIIDRNSCEVTTCDVIRFDKKPNENIISAWVAVLMDNSLISKESQL